MNETMNDLAPLSDAEVQKLLTEWHHWDPPHKPQLSGPQCDQVWEYIQRLRAQPLPLEPAARREHRRAAITLDVIAYRMAIAVERAPDEYGDFDISAAQVIYDTDRLIDFYLANKSPRSPRAKEAVLAHRKQHAPLLMGETVAVVSSGATGTVVGRDGDQLCIRLVGGERCWFNEEDLQRLVPDADEVEEVPDAQV